MNTVWFKCILTDNISIVQLLFSLNSEQNLDLSGKCNVTESKAFVFQFQKVTTSRLQEFKKKHIEDD